MSGMKRLRRRVWAFFAKQGAGRGARGGAGGASGDRHRRVHLSAALPPAEARRLALVRFGGVQQAREKQREARGLMQVGHSGAGPEVHACARWGAIRDSPIGCGADPGAGHRRQRGGVQRGEHADAAAAAVSRTRSSWCGLRRRRAKCGLSCATYSTDAYDEFRAGSRSYQDVTGYFAFSSPGQPERCRWERRAGAGDEHRRDREFLPGAGRAAGDGAAVHARRMRAMARLR